MAAAERVLVVGGGIGGLAAGVALAQRGVAVDIVERREAFAVPGVGLGQPANALRALDTLGVLDRILAAGFPFEHLKVFGPSGELIVDHRFRLGGKGIPPIAALPRRDIHRILLDAATRAGARIRMGTVPERLEQSEDAVEVTFADGAGGRYEMVAGFDGYRSWTRRQILGSAYRPEDSGYAAWRLIVQRPPEVTSMQFHQGLGHKTGMMPLTDATMYLFHIRAEPEQPDREGVPMVDSLRERLADYGGLIGELRDALRDDDQVSFSPLEPLFVGEPWHRGRVAIGGDAAHTYPPHMTQGAAMALEDAVVLAQEVAADGPLRQRLGEYRERRRERCRYVEGFAGRMLRDEQRVKTTGDLEEAKRSGFADLDGRLSESDAVMDEDVLASAAPRAATRAGRG